MQLSISALSLRSAQRADSGTPRISFFGSNRSLDSSRPVSVQIVWAVVRVRPPVPLELVGQDGDLAAMQGRIAHVASLCSGVAADLLQLPHGLGEVRRHPQPRVEHEQD